MSQTPCTRLDALSPIYVTNTTFHSRNVSLFDDWTSQFIKSCLSNRTIRYCAVPWHLTVVSIPLDQNKHIHRNCKIIHRWPFLQGSCVCIVYGFLDRQKPTLMTMYSMFWHSTTTTTLPLLLIRNRAHWSCPDRCCPGSRRPCEKSMWSLKIWYGWNSMGGTRWMNYRWVKEIG